MWRELTEADVQGVLNAAEVAAYKRAAIASGQNPLTDAVRVVVNQCRGDIADNPENRLAEGLTLPERVHLAALHLIRMEMLTRLNIEASSDRAKAATTATRYFERVARGEVKIEQPDGAVEDGGSNPKIKVLSDHERQATRKKLSGL